MMSLLVAYLYYLVKVVKDKQFIAGSDHITESHEQRVTSSDLKGFLVLPGPNEHKDALGKPSLAFICAWPLREVR